MNNKLDKHMHELFITDDCWMYHQIINKALLTFDHWALRDSSISLMLSSASFTLRSRYSFFCCESQHRRTLANHARNTTQSLCDCCYACRSRFVPRALWFSPLPFSVYPWADCWFPPLTGEWTCKDINAVSTHNLLNIQPLCDVVFHIGVIRPKTHMRPTPSYSLVLSGSDEISVWVSVAFFWTRVSWSICKSASLTFCCLSIIFTCSSENAYEREKDYSDEGHLHTHFSTKRFSLLKRFPF